MVTEKSFEELLFEYRPLLIHLSKRYCIHGQLEEGYSIAQIAFYEAYTQFDPEKGYFGAYVKRYVTGRLLTFMQKEIQWRERHTLPSQYGEWEESWEEQIRDDTPFLRELELSEEVKTAFHLLTESERKVLIHYFILDKPLADYAKQAGVSHSTAATLKRRGLAKLKKKLTALNEDVQKVRGK